MKKIIPKAVGMLGVLGATLLANPADSAKIDIQGSMYENAQGARVLELKLPEAADSTLKDSLAVDIYSTNDSDHFHKDFKFIDGKVKTLAHSDSVDAVIRGINGKDYADTLKVVNSPVENTVTDSTVAGTIDTTGVKGAASVTNEAYTQAKTLLDSFPVEKAYSVLDSNLANGNRLDSTSLAKYNGDMSKAIDAIAKSDNVRGSRRKQKDAIKSGTWDPITKTATFDFYHSTGPVDVAGNIIDNLQGAHDLTMANDSLDYTLDLSLKGAEAGAGRMGIGINAKKIFATSKSGEDLRAGILPNKEVGSVYGSGNSKFTVLQPQWEFRPEHIGDQSLKGVLNKIDSVEQSTEDRHTTYEMTKDILGDLAQYSINDLQAKDLPGYRTTLDNAMKQLATAKDTSLVKEITDLVDAKKAELDYLTSGDGKFANAFKNLVQAPNGSWHVKAGPTVGAFYVPRSDSAGTIDIEMVTNGSFADYDIVAELKEVDGKVAIYKDSTSMEDLLKVTDSLQTGFLPEGHHNKKEVNVHVDNNGNDYVLSLKAITPEGDTLVDVTDTIPVYSGFAGAKPIEGIHKTMTPRSHKGVYAGTGLSLEKNQEVDGIGYVNFGIDRGLIGLDGYIGRGGDHRSTSTHTNITPLVKDVYNDDLQEWTTIKVGEDTTSQTLTNKREVFDAGANLRVGWGELGLKYQTEKGDEQVAIDHSDTTANRSYNSSNLSMNLGGTGAYQFNDKFGMAGRAGVNIVLGEENPHHGGYLGAQASWNKAGVAASVMLDRKDLENKVKFYVTKDIRKRQK